MSFNKLIVMQLITALECCIKTSYNKFPKWVKKYGTYTKKFINTECHCHWATSHKTQADSVSFLQRIPTPNFTRIHWLDYLIILNHRQTDGKMDIVSMQGIPFSWQRAPKNHHFIPVYSFHIYIQYKSLHLPVIGHSSDGGEE